VRALNRSPRVSRILTGLTHCSPQADDDLVADLARTLSDAAVAYVSMTTSSVTQKIV
jgi:hypothetical protein